MRFGMPTLIENKTLRESAALCAELGLSFLELNMNLPQYQVQTMEPGYMKAVAEEFGICYTIHLDENLNVADFNPLVANAYRDTVLQTIELAKGLNVPVLNMHMFRGVYFTLPDRKVYLFEQYREEFLSSMVQFRDACEKAVGDCDIKLCVENWSGYTPWQIEALDALLESPVFGLTFDVGHNHGIGGADEPLILARGERLHHMHLHDVKDGNKDHQALGTGELDIRKYLALAEERQCSVVLETKTIDGLRRSVQWIKTARK